ncbi:MAG: hypothetical protein AAF216_03535 [Pseudomonadota bacterium]
MRLVLLSAAALFLATPVSADDLIAKAKAMSTEGPLYNYEMSYSDSEIEEARGTVYPTAPVGERLRISYPAEEDWPDGYAGRVADMDAGTDGEIWCTEFLESVPSDAQRTSETEGAVTYTFTPEPSEDADGTEKKLFRKLIGTLTLDPATASVQSFQMHLPEPMKPNFLAKIDTFSMFAQCDIAPDGRSFASQFDMELVGNAMGQSFGETISRQVTKLLDPVARPLP